MSVPFKAIAVGKTGEGRAVEIPSGGLHIPGETYRGGVSFGKTSLALFR